MHVNRPENLVFQPVYEQQHHRWLLVITCAILQVLLVDGTRPAETYPCLKSEATLAPDLWEPIWECRLLAGVSPVGAIYSISTDVQRDWVLPLEFPDYATTWPKRLVFEALEGRFIAEP